MVTIIGVDRAELMVVGSTATITAGSTGEVWTDTAPKGSGPFEIKMADLTQEITDVINNWTYIGKSTIGGVEIIPQVTPGSIIIPKPIPPLEKDVRYPISVQLRYQDPATLPTGMTPKEPTVEGEPASTPLPFDLPLPKPLLSENDKKALGIVALVLGLGLLGALLLRRR